MRDDPPARDEWPRLRPSLPSFEALRTALWFWPAVAAFVAFLVGNVLGNIHPAADSSIAPWAWPGDYDSASAFLQVVAGSVITVTSLTFSLVVVALQLASQQFSPRLLREFARDVVTQLVLGVLVTTFVVAITTLRGLDRGEPVPVLAMALTFVLVLMSIMALLGFVGHIARLVRVDTMMAAVHRQTRQTIEEHYVGYGEERREPRLPREPRDGDPAVCAARSGFVRRVDVPALIATAERHDVVLVLGVRPGDHVTNGAPVGRVLSDGRVPDEVPEAFRRAIDVSYERTSEQDVALGLRQLTDIAIKALSPAINDPTTAAHSIGHASDLLVRLVDRHLGPVVHAGDDGRPRVLTPDRDLRYYLDLVVGPIRRYSASEPMGLCSLLRMLRDVAVAARDEEQRDEIERQVRLILETTGTGLIDDDRAQVDDAAARVLDALRGRPLEAYTDRAGETRSL